MLALSRALFKHDLSLLDFPALKCVRALGISDDPIYARPLERLFSYTNTYFHQQPHLDLTAPPIDELGRYDILICSEVLEHVNAPVEAAIAGICSLLKPTGFALITVPYSLAPSTVEHFGNLAECALTTIGGKTVLVGRDEGGQYQVFSDLLFHGGNGATLERRIFGEAALKRVLHDGGFSDVLIQTGGSEEFGVVYGSPCSLPVIASNGAGSALSLPGVEFVEAFVRGRRALRQIADSRWFRLGRYLGLGPRVQWDL